MAGKRKNARERKLEFNLDIKDIWNMYESQNRKCKLSLFDIYFDDRQDQKLTTASIDRIDSSIGYIISNIQLVDKKVNRCKWKLSQDDFITTCKLVDQFNGNFVKLEYLDKKRTWKWRGCGNLSGSYWEQVCRNAKQRDIDVNINVEEAWSIFVDQGGLCYFSGVPLIMELSNRNRNDITSFNASLDRIDRTKSYIKDNCRWVDKKINMSKGTTSDEQYRRICSAVSNNTNLSSGSNIL